MRKQNLTVESLVDRAISKQYQDINGPQMSFTVTVPASFYGTSHSG